MIRLALVLAAWSVLILGASVETPCAGLRLLRRANLDSELAEKYALALNSFLKSPDPLHEQLLIEAARQHLTASGLQVRNHTLDGQKGLEILPDAEDIEEATALGQLTKGLDRRFHARLLYHPRKLTEGGIAAQFVSFAKSSNGSEVGVLLSHASVRSATTDSSALHEIIHVVEDRLLRDGKPNILHSSWEPTKAGTTLEKKTFFFDELAAYPMGIYSEATQLKRNPRHNQAKLLSNIKSFLLLNTRTRELATEASAALKEPVTLLPGAYPKIAIVEVPLADGTLKLRIPAGLSNRESYYAARRILQDLSSLCASLHIYSHDLEERLNQFNADPNLRMRPVKLAGILRTLQTLRARTQKYF